jgi:hypothetical protein
MRHALSLLIMALGFSLQVNAGVVVDSIRESSYSPSTIQNAKSCFLANAYLKRGTGTVNWFPGSTQNNPQSWNATVTVVSRNSIQIDWSDGKTTTYIFKTINQPSRRMSSYGAVDVYGDGSKYSGKWEQGTDGGLLITTSNGVTGLDVPSSYGFGYCWSEFFGCR